jgi:hypothetical protein
MLSLCRQLMQGAVPACIAASSPGHLPNCIAVLAQSFRWQHSKATSLMRDAVEELAPMCPSVHLLRRVEKCNKQDTASLQCINATARKHNRGGLLGSSLPPPGLDSLLQKSRKNMNYWQHYQSSSS